MSDEKTLLKALADAARPFLNLKDKGSYVMGVITQEDITRLEEALEAVAMLGEGGEGGS